MLKSPSPFDLKVIKRLYKIVFFKKKKEIILFIFSVILGSFAEVFSISAIFPFILVIFNPEEIFKIQIFNSLILYFNLSETILLNYVVALFIFSTLIALFLKLFNLYYGLNISANIGNYLSCQAFYSSINQKYNNHINYKYYRINGVKSKENTL